MNHAEYHEWLRDGDPEEAPAPSLDAAAARVMCARCNREMDYEEWESHDCHIDARPRRPAGRVIVVAEWITEDDNPLVIVGKRIVWDCGHEQRLAPHAGGFVGCSGFCPHCRDGRPLPAVQS